jgi:Cu+-exporting ATPase
LGPVAAAIVHQVGSLLVLLSAIRILGFERWHELPFVRAGGKLTAALARFRPEAAAGWLWRRRRFLARVAVTIAALAYLGSGTLVIGPGQAGVLRRFGRYRPPLLRPGLHIRFPAPIESVNVVEPDRSRQARIGLTASTAGASRPVSWNTAHAARRDESALFFTGDENLIELAGVVDYRFTEAGLPGLLFGVAEIENAVTAAAEGVFREVIGRTSLEALLVSRRHELEVELARRLQVRLDVSGVGVSVDRVRVVDAHPPREVVPAYRDVSAAVSDAERSLNQARAAAAETHWSALAEAETTRDLAKAQAARLVNRAQGEKRSFLAKSAAHGEAPALAEFRLLCDTLAKILPGRSKLILDSRAAGRRHLWIADPDQLSPVLGRSLEPAPAPVATEPRAAEPDD